MAYAVRFTTGADRSLRRLETSIQKRIVRSIESLADNPRPAGVRKLAGADDLWRLRVGDYRVIHEIRDRALLVLIVTVGHRVDVHR